MRASISLTWSVQCLLSVYSALAVQTNADSSAGDRVAGLPYLSGEQPLHESYAGHITVRTWTPEGGAPKDSGKASLFYWYFPAISPKVEEPPLLLWIQGGPGSSSMIGLFTEMGPLELTDDGEFTRRNVTWANEYDLLVVDQPAGTGFSSVNPQANLTLDDLYPLAKQVPEKDREVWRAKYPGNVNQYSSITSPMPVDMISAIAQATLAELMHPNLQLPSHIEPFLQKLAHSLSLRHSEAALFGNSPKRQKLFSRPDMDDLKILDPPSFTGASNDIYMVNGGYRGSLLESLDQQEIGDEDKTIWERIGLSRDESGDFVSGYAANMRAVGKDMWTFMQQFFDMRPALRKRDFYIFSESYGGKYVPAIATYIDQENTRLPMNDPRTIKLRGLSIGNSWVHPPLQILAHGGIGFSWGLLDANQADTVDLLAFKALNHTLSGDLEAGNTARLLMFDYYRNVTGGVNWYDVRKRNHSYKRKYLESGLNNPVVRSALHSKDAPYGVDWGVYYHLTSDIMRTSAPMFAPLLEKYSVNLYQGQFDFRDGVAGNTLWINELDWPERSKFSMADRQQWWLGNELVGYKRSGGNLAHWVVLNAGHMSPGDQPDVCFDMAKRIVS